MEDCCSLFGDLHYGSEFQLKDRKKIQFKYKAKWRKATDFFVIIGTCSAPTCSVAAHGLHAVSSLRPLPPNDRIVIRENRTPVRY